MKRVRELSRCFMSQFSHHITGCLFQGSKRARKMLSGYWKHIVPVLVLNAREQHRHNLTGENILQCLFMVCFFCQILIIIEPNNQVMIFWGYTHTAPCIDNSGLQLSVVCLLCANKKLIFLFFFFFFFCSKFILRWLNKRETQTIFCMTNMKHLFSSSSSSFITWLSMYKKTLSWFSYIILFKWDCSSQGSVIRI